MWTGPGLKSHSTDWRNTLIDCAFHSKKQVRMISKYHNYIQPQHGEEEPHNTKSHQEEQSALSLSLSLPLEVIATLEGHGVMD